ncbi:MAG: Hsp70 family protein [Gammaproteobacteria bacterium]|nr:Hsp70 family protein [Gammaproteobacteria bacterium]MBT6078752.1 Hsp70 family protein [Gammaproteobacteria bacterium]MBT7023023.1 Hsp70 family protein [Gammaproteobacteria bacterium]
MSHSTSTAILGIDLGTTNSEVAILHNGRIEVVEVSPGERRLPSCVGLADDGSTLIGNSARNQLALHPERTIHSVKRHMGKEVDLTLGDQHYSPQEISAMILRRLKEIAEQQSGERYQRAVITVPAFFSDAQRQATREAGEIAGLSVERIINEPTAAAVAYEGEHSEPLTILVYDLGGGTFDVSVVRIEQQVVEVLASHGNNQLGGDDFDQLIAEMLMDHLQQEHEVDITESLQAMARIRDAAERAKLALSDSPYYTVEEENLIQHKGRSIHLSLELSRDDYEQAISSLINETMQAIHTALDGANLSVAELDRVLLVGGSTRTPLIQQRIKKELGIDPRFDIDPDLCVAQGAATQGALINGDEVGTVLVDITPYTFGTSVIGFHNGRDYPHCFSPIIPKNSPIPVTRSEAYYTSYDGQDAVNVTVYQGEDPDALNNTEIGRYLVEELQDRPSGSAIIITFALDINGILHVTTLEKETGREEELVIDNAIGRLDEDKMVEARARIEQLFSDDEESQLEDESAADGIDSQIKEAQQQIKLARERMGALNETDQEDLIEIIEAIQDGIDQAEEKAIHSAVEELQEFFHYIE